METIHLSKAMKVKGEDVQDLALDFDKITGRVLIETESKCRALSDGTPDLTFSMKYQAMLAAKAAGVKYDDILDLGGSDMILVIAAVKSFLFNPASEAKPEKPKPFNQETEKA